MEAYVKVTGLVAPMDRVNVDTDQICPAQFLKRIERTGFGQFLFHSWRFREDGSPNPDFVLNEARYQGASVLVTGPNFGCGSSREHAPWALEDYGFRTVIAPSFADIFYNNCFQNGMLPVVLPEERVNELIKRAQKVPGYKLSIDLENCTVTDDEGFKAEFKVDPFRRNCLLNGLDDIGLTLQNEDRITAFEKRRPAWTERF
ncbi:MAG: 3-isopropylmalate dehydratase small subunit [Dehalococcoidia bacterium]|nr:3-isopropylmalate dehydratase small subunit [Dehalococcoidia bacterium]